MKIRSVLCSLALASAAIVVPTVSATADPGMCGVRVNYQLDQGGTFYVGVYTVRNQCARTVPMAIYNTQVGTSPHSTCYSVGPGDTKPLLWGTTAGQNNTWGIYYC
jgi:hypothetical protein